MKKYLPAGLFCIFAVGMISLAAISAFRDNVLSAGDMVSSQPVTCRYILKTHEGKIGVFRPGEAEPERVLDIYVNTLTPYDALALDTGIEIADDKALQKQIEAFDS